MAYDIFPYLSDNEQLELLQRARVDRFEEGAIVIDQNVESRSIYIVRDGSVVVELYDRGAWVQLAHLGQGEIFGEMSFVDGESTSARIVCSAPSMIAIITPHDLDTLEKELHGVTERMYRSIAAILAQRLRAMSRRGAVDQQWG